MMVWLILLPLFWTSLIFLLGPGRGGWLALVGIVVQLWLALSLSGEVVESGRVLHETGGWGAPLGIDLTADGLSAVMILLAQCVILPLAIYAYRFFNSDDPSRLYFWPMAGLLLAALNSLFLTADLFNAYVTLELMSLTAVGLVAIGGGAQQLSAALRYLFATMTGSGFYLLGVALIYGTYGTVSIETLVQLINADAPRVVWFAAGLMILGLMVKSALFPFHFWLPPAHGGAAAPVSALLSAVVVKASFYLILRLWTGPFAALMDEAKLIIWIPALLGAGAILWGSYKAIRAARLKMLIAYSTVAQLGYLFLIFPMLNSLGALQAGIMQVFAHGFAKAAMFAAAGVLIKSTGEDLVAGLAGVAERFPVTLFAFGLAGITLMGLPPSAGFLAKWQLIEIALSERYWFIALVVLMGGLLAAVYVFRILRQAFLLAPPDSSVMRPVPKTLEWTAFLLAAISVLLGLRSVELMQLVGIS